MTFKATPESVKRVTKADKLIIDNRDNWCVIFLRPKRSIAAHFVICPNDRARLGNSASAWCGYLRIQTFETKRAMKEMYHDDLRKASGSQILCPDCDHNASDDPSVPW